MLFRTEPTGLAFGKGQPNSRIYLRKVSYELPSRQKTSGGVVLNLASIAATAGLSERFAYSMTKGAVLAMTLSAARGLLLFGIRVNCMSPARVYTPFVEGFLAGSYPGREGEMMFDLAKSQPIGRMGNSEKTVQMARYLCSDAASFITGADMPIDGGFATLR